MGDEPPSLFAAIARGDSALCSSLLTAGSPASCNQLKYTRGSVPELDRLGLAEGSTPLHAACRLKLAPIVRVLLSKGANTSARDADHRTALDIALDAGDDDLAGIIREAVQREPPSLARAPAPMGELPITALPGVGARIAERLGATLNAHSIADLANLSDSVALTQKVRGLAKLYPLVLKAREKLKEAGEGAGASGAGPKRAPVPNPAPGHDHGGQQQRGQQPESAAERARAPAVDASAEGGASEGDTERERVRKREQVVRAVVAQTQQMYRDGDSVRINTHLEQAHRAGAMDMVADAIHPLRCRSSFALRCAWESLVESKRVDPVLALQASVLMLEQSARELARLVEGHLFGSVDGTGAGGTEALGGRSPTDVRGQLTEFFGDLRAAHAFAAQFPLCKDVRRRGAAQAGEANEEFTESMRRHPGFPAWYQLVYASDEGAQPCAVLSRLASTFITFGAVEAAEARPQGAGALRSAFLEPSTCGWWDFVPPSNSQPYFVGSTVGWFRCAWVALRAMAKQGESAARSDCASFGEAVKRWRDAFLGELSRRKAEVVLDACAHLADDVCGPVEWVNILQLVAMVGGYLDDHDDRLPKRPGQWGRWTPVRRSDGEALGRLAQVFRGLIQHSSGMYEFDCSVNASADELPTSQALPAWP